MGDHIGEGKNQYVLSVVTTINTLQNFYVLSHSLCQTKQKNSKISEVTFPSGPGRPLSLTLCC